MATPSSGVRAWVGFQVYDGKEGKGTAGGDLTRNSWKAYINLVREVADKTVMEWQECMSDDDLVMNSIPQRHDCEAAHDCEADHAREAAHARASRLCREESVRATSPCLAHEGSSARRPPPKDSESCH